MGAQAAHQQNVHGGGALSVIQDYQYLDLKPLSMKLI
jgi:hypothetical protein